LKLSDLRAVGAILGKIAVAPESRTETKKCLSGTRNLTGKNGHSDRHQMTIEMEDKYPKNRTTCSDIQDLWQRSPQITSLFPDTPISERELRAVTFKLISFLGVNLETAKNAVGKIGLIPSLRILEQIAKDIDKIASPSAYFMTAMTKQEALNSTAR